MAMTKQEIRKEIKNLIKQTFQKNENYRKDESKNICNKILSSSEYKSADLIFGFMPMQSEVDVLPVLYQALKDGKKLALPKVIPQTSLMDFYFVTREQLDFCMKKGAFGIFEPDSSDQNFLKVEFLDLQQESVPMNILILVPALAFTEKGNRLGRGKGFYDIFMADLQQKVISQNKKISLIKMGVCFQIQILQEIPVFENDINVDSVIF